jgi:uncharacterized protein YbbC (DUF1343 family)
MNRILVFLLLYSAVSFAGPKVQVGAEVLIAKRLDLLKGKRVGVVCNHTAVLWNGVHLVDTLLALGIHLTALYAPEHGIRGQAGAGVEVGDSVDARTGLRIYSLYGGTRQPTAEMLGNVDVIVFDMQDAGTRFYTYLSTMTYVMMAGATYGKQVIVLDRPNPINGLDIEGPVFEMTLTSFFGLFPVPIRHGMTFGEIATMITKEGMINPASVDLTVIPMEGWRRSMWFDETGRFWIAPSPNMKSVATATVYPGTCLFEATNITEGRGTPKPFEYIGGPAIDKEHLADRLNKFKLPGVVFEPVDFTPRTDAVAAPNPKFRDKECHGVYVKVTNRRKYRPVLTGFMMLAAFQELYPKQFEVRQGYLDRLIGDELVSQRLITGKLGEGIFSVFRKDLAHYREVRKKYLLYR